MRSKSAQKVFLYVNSKKCCFLLDIVGFLDYVVSLQSVYMKDEKIETIRYWPEP